MNIKFVNKTSETAFRNTLRDPVYSPQVIDWLCFFLKGVWTETETDIKLLGNNDTRFDVCNISGYVEELTIYCRGNNLIRGPAGPFSKEFSWNLYAHPVDKYGTPFSDNGRFIDYGTLFIK